MLSAFPSYDFLTKHGQIEVRPGFYSVSYEQYVYQGYRYYAAWNPDGVGWIVYRCEPEIPAQGAFLFPMDELANTHPLTLAPIASLPEIPSDGPSPHRTVRVLIGRPFTSGTLRVHYDFYTITLIVQSDPFVGNAPPQPTATFLQLGHCGRTELYELRDVALLAAIRDLLNLPEAALFGILFGLWQTQMRALLAVRATMFQAFADGRLKKGKPNHGSTRVWLEPYPAPTLQGV
jgi:hypothetical protein